MCEVAQTLRTGRLSSEPQHRMQRSQPPDHLLMWAVAGAGHARSGRRSTRANSGTVMVLPAGQPHAYASDADHPWDLLWVHFHGRAADDWAHRFGQNFGLAAPLDVTPGLLEAFTELIAVHHAQPDAARLADHLLWALLGRIEHRLQLGRQSPGPQHAEALARVQRYIHDHQAEPLSVEQLAAVAGLSVRHFTRLCRSAWQLAPMTYVIRQRLATACLLLTETSLPIGRIATDVGFCDPYHFSRTFRRHYHQSPSSWRRAHQTP